MNPYATASELEVVKVGMYLIHGNALYYGALEYKYLICVAVNQEMAMQIAQAFIDADKTWGF